MAFPILLLLRDGVELIATKKDGLVVRTRKGEATLEGLKPGAQAALIQLHGAGVAEDDLLALVIEKDGGASLPALYFTLESLARNGLLAYRAAGEAGPLATATCATPRLRFRRRAIDPEANYALSRFAFVRREGDRLVIESPLSAAQAVVHDPRVAALIFDLATPRRLDAATASCGLSESEGAVLGSLLLSCDVVGLAGDSGGVAAEEEGALSFWQFHDLLFHARSRVGRHLGGWADLPVSRSGRPSPATKADASDEAVDLFRPDLERLAREDVPFSSVLEGRRSIRSFGEPPLHRRQLGEFLYRAARQRSTFEGDNGQQLGSRPYPGGGALYELEIYLSVGLCQELPMGFYHYCPRQHRLFKVASRPELVGGPFAEGRSALAPPAAGAGDRRLPALGGCSGNTSRWGMR